MESKETTEDLQECIGCGELFDFEIMVLDDAGENYCPECWEELKDDIQAEYQRYIESENQE